jgi:hypothetical protein
MRAPRETTSVLAEIAPTIAPDPAKTAERGRTLETHKKRQKRVGATTIQAS